MKTSKRRGNLFMSVLGTAAVTNYYPDPSAGPMTTPTNGYGYGASGPTSPFADTLKDAIIYSIHCYAISGGTQPIEIETHTGGYILTVTSASSGIGNDMTFGENGLRVPEGFRVQTQGTGVQLIVIEYSVE